MLIPLILAEDTLPWVKGVSDFVKELGLPVALVVFFCYCGWKGGSTVWDALWPKASELLEAMRDRQTSMAEEYRKTTALMSDMVSKTQQMQQIAMETHRANTEVLNRLASLCGHPRRKERE